MSIMSNNSKHDPSRKYQIQQGNFKIIVQPDIKFEHVIAPLLSDAFKIQVNSYDLKQKIEGHDQINQISEQLDQQFPIIYFLKGQFIEIQPKIQPAEIDLLKKYYQRGSTLLEPLCCFRQAIFLSQKQKFKIQSDQEQALLNLIIGSSLVQFCYGKLPDFPQTIIRQVLQQFEENLNVPQALVTKKMGSLSDIYKQNIEFILNLFKLQYYPQEESQTHYNNCFQFLKQQIKEQKPKSIRNILRLLTLTTRNHNKNIPEIGKIMLTLAQKPELVEQTLQEMQINLQLFSQSQYDNYIFDKERALFIEFYESLIRYSKPILLDKKCNAGKICRKIIEILDQNKAQFHNIDNSYHNAMLFRIQSELDEKGIGIVEANLQKSKNWLEKELEIPNRDELSFAYTYYQLSKSKYNNEKILGENQKILSSEELVSKAISINEMRSQSHDTYLQLSALYYLGRLHLKQKYDLSLAITYLSMAEDLYQERLQQFETVITLQYRIFFEKVEKQLSKFHLNVAEIPSIPSDSCQQLQEQTSPNPRQQQSDSQQQQQQQQQHNEQQQQPSQQQREEMSSLSDKQVLIDKKLQSEDFKHQLSQIVTVYDPRSIIILRHIGKNYLGNKYLALLSKQQEEESTPTQNRNFNMIQEIFQAHKFKTQSEIEEILEKQIVVLNTIELVQKGNFRKLLNFLKKIVSNRKNDGVVCCKGISIEQLSDSAFRCILIYDKFGYNLYEARELNLANTLKDKLQLLLNLAQVISAMHEQSSNSFGQGSTNYYHGSLHPASVLVNRDLKVKVMDWEYNEIFSNRFLDDDDVEQQEKSNLIFGYASPEQVRLQTNSRQSAVVDCSKIDSSCDIWSLGMIFNFILFNNDGQSLEYQQKKKIYQQQDLVIETEEYNNIQCNKPQIIEALKELVQNMVRQKVGSRMKISTVCSSIQSIMSKLTTK